MILCSLQPIQVKAKSLAFLWNSVRGSGGSLEQDENGGYDFDNVNEWVTARGME